jgi:hypothetical protein
MFCAEDEMDEEVREGSAHLCRPSGASENCEIFNPQLALWANYIAARIGRLFCVVQFIRPICELQSPGVR